VRIVQIVQYIHHMSTASATSLHKWVQGQLSGIFSQAHDLSLRTKRDILSVQMRIIRSSCARFSFAECQPGWDKMGTADGEEILGQFAFGLLKVSENGVQSISLRPAVVTTSLLRCAGVASMFFVTSDEK
jgi:hypothetical protein